MLSRLHIKPSKFTNDLLKCHGEQIFLNEVLKIHCFIFFIVIFGMFLSHCSSICVRSSKQWGDISFKSCLKRVSIEYWLISCGINGVEGLGRGDTKDCVRGHRDHYLPGQFRNSHHYRCVCEVCYGNKISLFVSPFHVIDC